MGDFQLIATFTKSLVVACGLICCATPADAVMEGSHFSWSGDGSYFLLGNGQMRGRKWDEPLPGNIRFLAAISTGDVSPCGRSGRWICGESGVAEIRVADLRSGDGWPVLETNSFLCFPSDQDFSGPYDIDLKGSPDGTKIAFVCTYEPLGYVPNEKGVRRDEFVRSVNLRSGRNVLVVKLQRFWERRWLFYASVSDLHPRRKP